MRNSELQALTTEVAGAGSKVETEPRPAELHVVYPLQLATTIVLDRPSITLGRQPGDGTPPLLHTLVSRKHFVIEWDAAQHFHTGVDLGSSNGSAVDGIPAKTPLALRDGSVLRVGPVLLVYERSSDARLIDTPVAVDPSIEAAIPGRSSAARALRARVALVAKDPAAVLVRGETGTGKESISQEIHRLSERRGAFIALNCAALAAQLLESELFGHVRGAFSGATQEHHGLFRAAHGGTLLLDEIGELDLALQPKLLRALQESAVRPVGATRDVPVDVRVIAATNRDLAARVESDEFRRDLHARLALWEIEVPPLRKRRADLFIWLERLHARFRQARGMQPAPLPAFETEAAEALLMTELPDNLRGLDRIVHALSAVPSDRPLVVSDLPTAFAASAPPPVLSTPEELRPAPSIKPPIPTREELAAVLAQNGGSVRATAKHFDRDRKQVYRWLEQYGLKGD